MELNALLQLLAFVLEQNDNIEGRIQTLNYKFDLQQIAIFKSALSFAMSDSANQSQLSHASNRIVEFIEFTEPYCLNLSKGRSTLSFIGDLGTSLLAGASLGLSTFIPGLDPDSAEIESDCEYFLWETYRLQAYFVAVILFHRLEQPERTKPFVEKLGEYFLSMHYRSYRWERYLSQAKAEGVYPRSDIEKAQTVWPYIFGSVKEEDSDAELQI